jgi:hypothetical protein
MRDITIGQGETIRQTITVEDDGADTATFIATDGVSNLIEFEVAFVEKVANISTTDTIIPVGTYDYYIRIDWSDGTVDYLPDFSDCEGECTLPSLIVCEIPGVS